MKIDNPTDHEHGAYVEGTFKAWVTLAALFALFALWSLFALWGQASQIDDLERRQDALECRIAPDETRCLRELVED